MTEHPDERPGLTRRRALALAGGGALAAGVGVAGLVNGWGSPFGGPLGGRAIRGSGGVPGAELADPEELVSSGGRLALTLTATAGAAEIAGRPVETLSYNGSVPGPTLRVRPGDRITLDLENRLEQPTNLHTHGLHVSPAGNSDNVFVRVEPGETFRYEYAIPEDHPPGTFWYHPHLHGSVADQLFAGMVGTIIVEREDRVALPTERERVMVVSDVSLAGDTVATVSLPERMHGREGELLLVNGQLEPVVTSAPGAWEHWKLVNACCSRFLRLRLDGAEMLRVAGDAGPLATPESVDELVLLPGNRAELLIRFPDTGRHELVAEAVDRGEVGMGMGMGRAPAGSDAAVALLRVDVAGPAVDAPEVPTRLAEPEDLRSAAVDARRTLTLEMGMGMGRGPSLTIDGREFDHERVDTNIRLDTVEEWTIVNTSPMDHPFHLHVWPMHVIARDGRPVEGRAEVADVVNVPAGRRVTVRMRITDFPGRTVYHCHILDHEDLGMMGVVEATT